MENMQEIDKKDESEIQKEAQLTARKLEELKEFILKNDELYQRASQHTKGISIQEFQLLKIIHELDKKYMNEIQQLRNELAAIRMKGIKK